MNGVKFWNYTCVADRVFIGYFERSEYDLEEARALFSHVLAAQHFWACRIMGRDYRYGLFDSVSVADMGAIKTEHENDWLKLLNERDTSELIEYSSTSGRRYRNTIGDILYHVCNHSTHHRAQIARIWREAGLEPPISDLIYFERSAL